MKIARSSRPVSVVSGAAARHKMIVIPMNYFSLLLAAASSSADGFVAGAALGSGENARKNTVIAVLTVGAACFAASLFAELLGELLSGIARLVCGPILILLGFSGLIRRDEEKTIRENLAVGDPLKGLLTGLAVGGDGACVCVSLSLGGFGVEAAAVVTAFHFIFIEAGTLIPLAASKKISGAKICPIILILLGIYKLLF